MERPESSYQIQIAQWSKQQGSMSKSVLALHLKELSRCKKAFEAGNLAGLYDALCICKNEYIFVPEWALDASLKYFGNFLCDTLEPKRGRHSKWKQQYREDMTDYHRAEAVKECSENSIPWDHVYYAASLILSGTFAAGAEHAIEASYKRYMKRSKINPFRYYKSQFIKINGDSNSTIFTIDRGEIWDEVLKLKRVKDQG